MRYTKSIWKHSRRLGFSILENNKELQKRPYAPGQHGKQKKKSGSEYKNQLIEKQKLAKLYGINERQFRRLFLIARANKLVTGLAFFRILESRLDNLVYRMGFTTTRRAARQLVNHGHVLVNGKKNNIPSYLCSINDVISIREKSKKVKAIKDAIDNNKNSKFPTVKVDQEKMEGTFIREINKDEINRDINENQIIEWYNRLL